MDSFQLLAFLVDAVTTMGGFAPRVEFQFSERTSKYIVGVYAGSKTISAVDADLRVALRDVVIELDEQSRSVANPALDGFRLVATAQRHRREATKSVYHAAVRADLIAQAEALEAEALEGRAR